MDWIKRNLLFVVGLAVAVVLLGVGIFYFLGQMTAAGEATQGLEDASGKLDTLYKRDPFPNDANIKAAKAEQERVAAFKKTVLQFFAPPPLPEKLDTASFKALLENTIADLNGQAQRYGVKLPEKYSFTFESQRQQMQLDQKSLTPLSVQLQDIKQISTILFNSKIHELVSFKRSGVASNEVSGNDLLSKKTSSNAITGIVIYPYEVSFNCFSAELSAILASLASSKEMIVVKTINIERADEATTLEAPSMSSAPAGGMDPSLMARYGIRPGGMSPAMMMRYGLGGRPGAGAPAAAAPTTSSPGSTKPGGPVLDEKALRVTLGIDVLKLMPVKTPPPAAAKPAAARPAAAPAN
jgi:hypothetical protein